MLTLTQEIKRLEGLLNGETIEGLKLNDPGLNYQWVIQRIANLRQMKRTAEQTASNITLESGGREK